MRINNNNILFTLTLVLFLICTSPAQAGAFTGTDVYGDGTQSWYLGTQSEDIFYFGVFVGRNQYEIDNTSYNQGYMAAGLGYRWYSSWTTNVLLGLENSRVRKAGQIGREGDLYRGLYAQLGLMKFLGDKNLEYLLSYSAASEQLWTRFRLKYYTSSGFLLGPEFFYSRFLSTPSQGAGIVLEKVVFPFTITGKIGARNQSSEAAAYGGLELYYAY